MVAAGDQPGARALVIRLAALQFEPGLTIAERQGDGGEIRLKIGFLPAFAVPQQVHHGALLTLGPHALACHEGTRGGQQVHAGYTDQRQRQHNRNERPDDAQYVLTSRQGSASLPHGDSRAGRHAGTVGEVPQHVGGMTSPLSDGEYRLSLTQTS